MLHSPLTGNNDGGRSIGEWRGRTGGDNTSVAKYRWQHLQTLERRITSRAFVLIDHTTLGLHRYDLAVKLSREHRGHGSFVALKGKFVALDASDPVQCCHLLCGFTHR